MISQMKAQNHHLTHQTRDDGTMLFIMLGQRRRRWADIKTALFHRLVFAGDGLCHF